MDVFMIGLYRQGKKLAGVRLLDIDADSTSSQKCMDVSYQNLYNAIASGKLSVNNLKISGSVIFSVGGAFDRYGEPKKSQSLVILRELQDESGTKLGYMCSDTVGNIKYLTEKQVIDVAEYAVKEFNTAGIANGKVVTNSDGSKHISAIEGVYKVKKPNKTVPTLSNEVRGYIEKIKSLEKYKNPNCYARKVVNTVETTGKCSTKQLDLLEHFIKEASNSDNKVRARVVTEVKSEQADLLKYEIMTDGSGVVVTGLADKENIAKEVIGLDIYIPNFVELSGKSYAVKGIRQSALAGLRFKSIHVDSNMTDIGQGAFYMCNELEELDIEKSKITFIASNLCNGCYKLKVLKLNNSIQRIHENAFRYTGLLSVSIPISCETIARNAFAECKELTRVVGTPVVLNQGAFSGCKSLEEFNFSKVQRIESNTFEQTGFKQLEIPGTVNYIGRAAFRGCDKLKEVKIAEGVESIGEQAFGIYARLRRDDKKAIDDAWLPKSLKEIGAGAFDNCKKLHVYSGSVGESRAKGYFWDYVCVDAVNETNSTIARMKATLFGTSIVEQIHKELTGNQKDASNPKYEIVDAGLESIELNQQVLDFLKIEPIGREKEPHILFKAALNYFQNISKVDRQPLSNYTLRFADALIVNTETIMSDGYNSIYKISFTFKDTLETGTWILVLMGKKLVYMTILNNALNIKIDTCHFDNDLAIPVDYLHSGDTLGKIGTISGESTRLKEESGRVRYVGNELYVRLFTNSIIINRTNKESYWYIPAVDRVLLIREEKIKQESHSVSLIDSTNNDKISIIDIMKYDKFLIEAKKLAKKSNNYGKLFDDMYRMSTYDVDKRLTELKEIAEEKESYFFKISKELNRLVGNSETVSPNNFSRQLFSEISSSYFMVEKEVTWLYSINSKSLNKSNVYNFEGLRVTEYRSNQVVKFSNAYMNGVKGAYIFVVDDSLNGHRRVFTSRYTLDHIATELLNMTRYTGVDEIPTLMTNVDAVDCVNPKLFYDFVRILETTRMVNITSYRYDRASGLSYYKGAEFAISMYKPTGVFYVTINVYSVKHTYRKDGEQEVARKEFSIPLFPVGNIDRALRVADTTNVGVKDSNFFRDMVIVSVGVSTSVNMEELSSNNANIDRAIASSVRGAYHALLSERKSSTRDIDWDGGLKIFNNYLEARRMLIDGIGDTERYLDLIDSRAVYMVGTVAKGEVKRELGVNEIEPEIYEIDFEDETVKEVDTYIDDDGEYFEEDENDIVDFDDISEGEDADFEEELDTELDTEFIEDDEDSDDDIFFDEDGNII